MRFLFLILALIALAPCSHLVCAGVAIGGDDRFFEENWSSHWTYSKRELSGCVTRVKVDRISNLVNISNDIMRCKVNREKRESTVEIAASVYEIVTYFHLVERLKPMESICVNIGWNTNHEPLIRYMNEDKEWPSNIFQYSKTHSPKNMKDYEFLRTMVREEILKSGIYKPIIDVMKKLNCEMTLKDHFAEDLLFDPDLSRIGLTKNGVFRPGEAKKDVYPSINGGLKFDLKCEKQSNK
jgi:hypothetical protein